MAGEALYQVDAFTSEAFGGNPAAVCMLTEPRTDQWMQSVASEMNLSETAFLQPDGETFQLRWFTPALEVDLCGHATLASAHVLWQYEYVPSDKAISFETRSGTLAATRKGQLIELDFPLESPSPTEAPAGLIEALGVTPTYVGKNRFDYLVAVQSEQELRAAKPDFVRLREEGCRGVILTSPAEGSEFDFLSRFFAPSAGIDEDPVTGSAHCCLGAYWREQLNKNDFLAHQASARGGVVQVRVDEQRAYLGGAAVTVMAGKLLC